MIDPDTPCKVIPLKNGLQRMGRQGVAHLKRGSMLYYLWHEPTRLFYIECYVSEAYAIKKARETKGPRSMDDVRLAWRSEPKYCNHSFRTEDP